VEPKGYQHGYQSYPCLFQPQEIRADTVRAVNQARNEWMDALQQQGISTRPATHAVHLLSFYREKYDLKPDDFPNAYAADHCSISLPLFHGMSEAEQTFVIEAVIKRRS
jgi:perosamine synthetase